jgi:hypothetical protein
MISDWLSLNFHFTIYIGVGFAYVETDSVGAIST